MGGLLGGGGGGGGQRVCWSPLSNYWGAWPPLFLRLCHKATSLLVLLKYIASNLSKMFIKGNSLVVTHYIIATHPIKGT